MDFNNKKILELSLLWEINKCLDANISPTELLTSLEQVFQVFINAQNLNIYIIDEITGTIRDFSKTWWAIEDEKQKSELNIKFENASNAGADGFVLNKLLINIDNDWQNMENIKNDFLKPENNNFLFPISRKDKIAGLIELEFNAIDPNIWTIDLFLAVYLCAKQISAVISNIKLSQSMEMNISFQQTMKNIAKIIENQYELNYIMPIIAEMIDSFISEHLIYIFKNTGKSGFQLLWPNAYSENRINPLLKQAKTTSSKILSKDSTIGIFPLFSESKNVGAIVADGKFNKLSDKEIEYLEQLSRQASITIEKANTYAEVLKYATMDALTGLNNRRQLEIRLSQEVAAAKRKALPLCCIMLDVDFFKSINDGYGHAAGDYVLKEVAKIVIEQIRAYDIAARYGGEEFCILLPMTDIDEAKAVADRIREKVQETKFDISSFSLKKVKNISVTVSIGISKFKTEQQEISLLYKDADAALYKAKKSGRNKVVIFEEK